MSCTPENILLVIPSHGARHKYEFVGHYYNEVCKKQNAHFPSFPNSVHETHTWKVIARVFQMEALLNHCIPIHEYSSCLCWMD